MPPSKGPSIRSLELRLAAVTSELMEIAPALMKEHVLLTELLATRRSAATNDLATLKKPWKAIQIVLEERGTWMTKQQIADRLTVGGFIETRSEKMSINDTINKRCESGDLKTRGNAEAWEKEIGLPHFE
jgi:hypothetical protein